MQNVQFHITTSCYSLHAAYLSHMSLLIAANKSCWGRESLFLHVKGGDHPNRLEKCTANTKKMCSIGHLEPQLHNNKIVHSCEIHMLQTYSL